MLTLTVRFKYRLMGKSVITSQIVLVDVESDSDEREIKAQIMYYYYKYVDTPEIVDILPYEIITK